MKGSPRETEYKHLVQELRESKASPSKSIPRKFSSKSKKSDRVYLRVSRTCPVLENNSADRQNKLENNRSDEALSSTSGCSVASSNADDDDDGKNEDDNKDGAEIVVKLPQDGTTRGRPTSAMSVQSTQSLSSVDTLALTELEIWWEIDRRLTEEAAKEDGGDIKKYFMQDSVQDMSI